MFMTILIPNLILLKQAKRLESFRLDRMLVEYFLRAGYYTTALRLARHSGIEVSIILIRFQSKFL